MAQVNLGYFQDIFAMQGHGHSIVIRAAQIDELGCKPNEYDAKIVDHGEQHPPQRLGLGRRQLLSGPPLPGQ